MGLTDLFSKLIVEHGSAEVQAKHIALFKDQLAMADKKTTLLESENTILKTENEKLKSDFQESQKENEILRSKIQKYEKPTEQSTHKASIDEPKINILKHLFEYDNQQIEQIAQTLQLALQLAKYHAEELLEIKMIKNSNLYRQETTYQGSVRVTHQIPVPVLTIDQEGRKYLVENGMV